MLPLAEIHNLLNRLEKVKKLTSRKHVESYSALCPSHDDRNPSLCIDLTFDGRILLFCRAGCGAMDVLDAVSLKMTDLFPDNNYRRPPGPTRKEIDYAFAVSEIVKHDVKEQRAHSQDDVESIQRAISTLNQALEAAKCR